MIFDNPELHNGDVVMWQTDGMPQPLLVKVKVYHMRTRNAETTCGRTIWRCDRWRRATAEEVATMKGNRDMERKKATFEQRECSECGARFTPGGPRQQYCAKHRRTRSQAGQRTKAMVEARARGRRAANQETQGTGVVVHPLEPSAEDKDQAAAIENLAQETPVPEQVEEPKLVYGGRTTMDLEAIKARIPRLKPIEPPRMVGLTCSLCHGRKQVEAGVNAFICDECKAWHLGRELAPIPVPESPAKPENPLRWQTTSQVVAAGIPLGLLRALPIRRLRGLGAENIPILYWSMDDIEECLRLASRGSYGEDAAEDNGE